MTVEELIEELKKHPPQLSVVITTPGSNYGSDVEKVYGETYPKRFKDGAYHDENVPVVELLVSNYSPVCY